MPYTLSILKVEDFTQWKSAFDTEQGISLRKGGKMKSYQIFNTEDDPNKIVILCEWDDMDDARQFVQSEQLREASQQSGVIEEIDTYFLEEIEKRTV